MKTAQIAETNSILLAGGKQKENPTSSFWKTLFDLSRPYHKRLLFSFCIAVVVGVAVALQPLCIKWIVDAGIMRKAGDGQLLPVSQRFRYAGLFILLYLFLSAFRMLVWLAGYRGFIHSIEDMLCILRGRFFRHVQGLCFRFHDQVSSGELFSYIMGTPAASLRLFLQQFTMLVPFQVVSLCVASATLATFNLPMTLITLTMISVIVYVNSKSKYIMKEISADFMKTESNASKYVADMLNGARAVKIYAMEEQVNDSFNSHAVLMRNKGVMQTLRRQLEGMKPEGLHYFGMGVIYLSGTYFVICQDMALGTFFAFVTSISLLMGPIMTMMQLNLVRGNAEAGLERIMTILNVRGSTVEPADGVKLDIKQQHEESLASGTPCIEFCHVNFSYDHKKDILHNINCRIKHGEHVALVGPSGSGKSSFISLILRLYDPGQGEVNLNNADIQLYNSRELRSLFGVVPQSPFLFQASISDNIRVTRPKATRDEIKKAMEKSQIRDFVDDLPDGADTFLGENGFNLSGGQRQRIAIARAALQKPLFFIFDEATSALDNSSEQKIMETMEELTTGHTTFIIAHRLSTVKHVDRVMVFDNGRIVQDGSHKTLSQEEGLFKKLLDEGQMFN